MVVSTSVQTGLGCLRRRGSDSEISDRARSINLELSLVVPKRVRIIYLRAEMTNHLFFGLHLGFDAGHLDQVNPSCNVLAQSITRLRRVQDRNCRPYACAEDASSNERTKAP